MSGRNQKNKQRGQSAELLSELHSIRDLLGGDALGDIPLLDQVAEAGQHPAQIAAPKLSPRPAQEPLHESDLPILFSPIDEAPDEEITAELSEAEWELLRPLQELPGKPKTDKAQDKTEQQPGLFDSSADSSTPAAENPFLPAHIRARLTGGKVPRAEETQPPQTPLQQQAELAARPEADQQEQEVEPAAAQAPQQNAAQADTPTSKPMPGNQRQQLIDRLVAKQLPELERQLRERVAQMIDELEAKR